MRRRAPLAIPWASLLLASCIAGCAAAPLATSSGTPAPTADIKRGKLDISYTFLLATDVHRVSSKTALLAGLDAVRAEVKRTNGVDGVAAPELRDVNEPVLEDFGKFASAVAELAARNPQLAADTIADAAIAGMFAASPDCHTYYVDKSGGVHQSRACTVVGSRAQPPASIASVVPRDETGLVAMVLPDGIGYVTFGEFLHSGTYDTATAVRRALDALLAAGAKAWLFDLRGNVGGDPPVKMTSWFLNGQPLLRAERRAGGADTTNAVADLRLPDAYQLPVAIILNDRGGSSPEVFALGLHENGRATIVGQRSAGCLGATASAPLSDGSELYVVEIEHTGAITGSRYNGVGIPPDVVASDGTAVAVASALLRDQIAAHR